jgi:hypothetical protein
MFTSRMPIPYPPPGCGTAYIQNSRALVLPEGLSLPAICVQCGMPSDVVIKSTFHWPQPEPLPDGYGYRSPWITPLLDEIGFLFRCIFRLSTRITVGVPLCAGHHDEEKFWRWLGAVMTVIGLALIALNYTHFQTWPSRNDPAVFGTIVMLAGGTSLIFLGVNTLNLIELNTAFAAYQGFGVEYMKKMPHEVQIFGAKRAGVGLDSGGDSGHRGDRTSPTFTTDLL